MTLFINHAYTKKAVITKALLITLSNLIRVEDILLQKQLTDACSLIIEWHSALKDRCIKESKTKVIEDIKITLKKLFTKTNFVGSYEQINLVGMTDELSEYFAGPKKENAGSVNEQLPNEELGKCKARDDELTIAAPQEALNPPPQDAKLTDFSSDKVTDRCISSTPEKLASSDE